MFKLERPKNEVNNDYQRICNIDTNEVWGYLEDDGRLTFLKKVSLVECITIWNLASDYVQQQKYYKKQAKRLDKLATGCIID